MIDTVNNYVSDVEFAEFKGNSFASALMFIISQINLLSYFSTYIYFERNTFPWSIPYSNMLLKHMIILPSDPGCSDLLMKTVCYQNVIMTGNSSLNRRKWSTKRHQRHWGHHGMVTQGRDPWLANWSLDLQVFCSVVLFLFTLALTVLTKCTWSQLRYFLSIKKISLHWLYSKHWFFYSKNER